MNQIKLTDLEIKDGWLCKDGVKLINRNKLFGDSKNIFYAKFRDCKVKSATICTEVETVAIHLGFESAYYYKTETEEEALIDHVKKDLQAISQDPKAYATNIEI